MSINTKQTGEDIATLASKVLRDPHASALGKQLAGSALSQSSSTKQTGAEMEEIAGKIVSNSLKYSDTEVSLAGSVLAQSNKAR
ncbi:hypothetical protein [Pseudomonas fluorescens]|uniref:Uncharacterized protein n=1 Tax=Pseudomonas fluorescens TaxID=294 RepID=A0A4Y9TFH6_PSEFL|nr:hypothetical protein [Pseudomonas fluorescens]MBD8239482.1 hypothetical protein [Pseudomonas fluorescens]MDY0898472.1 hypothetical protein [Pseudomonas fluorescens]TFW43165.1 hypothetical protein E4T65_12430 [Pseudomonas fluorescens]